MLCLDLPQKVKSKRSENDTMPQPDVDSASARSCNSGPPYAGE